MDTRKAVASLAVDPNVLVRPTAIEALARMEARFARPVIEKSLQDPETSVRVSGNQASLKIGDRASTRSLPSFRMTDFHGRREAVRTLIVKADRHTGLIERRAFNLPEAREVATEHHVLMSLAKRDYPKPFAPCRKGLLAKMPEPKKRRAARL